MTKPLAFYAHAFWGKEGVAASSQTSEHAYIKTLNQISPAGNDPS